MKREQPTSEEWAEIRQRLGNLYDAVHLDCDGYAVNLMLGRVDEMELGIQVYVNGWFKGVWLIPERRHEEGRRFFQLRTRQLYSGSEIRAAEKALGKRRTKEMGFYDRIEYRSGYWRSFNSLRRHLVRENERIRWITAAEAEAYREPA